MTGHTPRLQGLRASTSLSTDRSHLHNTHTITHMCIHTYICMYASIYNKDILYSRLHLCHYMCIHVHAVLLCGLYDAI